MNNNIIFENRYKELYLNVFNRLILDLYSKYEEKSNLKIDLEKKSRYNDAIKILSNPKKIESFSSILDIDYGKLNECALYHIKNQSKKEK